jgi:UDP-glucose 4-epimerase
MKLLVTGGAGFIGSVTAAYLLDHGYEVNILDDLSEGHYRSVDSRANFFHGSILDSTDVGKALVGCKAVVHLAGKAIVSESIKDPAKYQLHNFIGTQILLNSMIDHSIEKIIFSSTCAVYGNPNIKSIDEKTNPMPINPYGESKLLADLEISKFTEKYNLSSVSLRFFNVAGSYTSKLNKLFGESHVNETHLIPRVLMHNEIEIYGTSFNTPDGTCVRDYVHVIDIANAIKLSLEKSIISGYRIYNLGSGTGISVNKIIEVSETILGRKITKKNGERRSGDPEYLVSNPDLAREELGWSTTLNITQILNDAQKFITNNS